MSAIRNLAVFAVASVLSIAVLSSAVGQEGKPPAGKTGGVAAPAGQDKPAAAKISGKTLITPEELKWAPLPGIPGAEFAKLVGDPAKEAHHAFFKYPAGLKAPMHAHSSGDRGVIISGTLSLAVEGAPAKKLGPGSFFSIGSKVPHTTAVEGESACVFYIEREGAFDVVTAEEKKKP